MDYSSLADDFYVNMNLNTEMELPHSRETVLHYFEQVKKHYPTMRNFHSRERGEFVLEEDKDRGDYRWTSIESRRICSGYVNPPSVEEALKQHAMVLDLVPYILSVSPLDCESLNVMYGFDFNYRGNHNQLVAEALGVSPALERMLEIPGASVVNYEPSLTLALDDDCRIQCRVSVESRTNAYQIRTGEFPEEQLSVYVTARQYGSLGANMTFNATLEQLTRVCREMVDNHVIEHVPDPCATLRALATVLKPGGAILGATPNAAAWDARLFGANWVGWHVPRHFAVFDPRTFARLVRDAGLELVSLRSSLEAGSHWAMSLHTAVARRVGWLPRPGRLRARIYPLLVALGVGVAAAQSLVATTSVMSFALRKPGAGASTGSAGSRARGRDTDR